MATPNATIKILVTGGSGYVGGSVLNKLLTSPDPNLQNVQYSVLLRNPSQRPYFESKGVKFIPFRDLEDEEVMKRTASEHDIVINCAAGFATTAARALCSGLGERQRQRQGSSTGTKKPLFMLHLSGSSNVGERPISKRYLEPRYVEGRPFLDTEDIDEYQRVRQENEIYPQRTTDVVLVDTGIAQNVPTYILMPPLIWGKGTGAFHKRSVQVPTLCNAALQASQAVVVGEGTGVIDTVHVEDLAQLFEKMLSTLIAGEKLPSGKQGIYFAEAGQNSWREIADGIAKAGKEIFNSDEVRSVSPDEAAKLMKSIIPPEYIELGFAVHARTKTVKAKAFWEPRYGREEFLKSFGDELEAARGLHD